MNPILPATAFIPDGEPHVFEYKGEKRVFLYGSRDERVTAYCGDGHDVWSAPVYDLTKWTNHGEIFHVNQVKDIGYGIKPNQHFGAPDCDYNPVTKKYYLYTFLGAPYKMDGKEGPLPGSPNYVPGFENDGPKTLVASSDSPTGPFTNPVMCDWPALNGAGSFDPAVLVDPQKDGSVRVYAYWGMKKGDRWAELDPTDMHTIINPQTRKPDRNAWNKTLPEPDKLNGSSLFEASSIRKVADGKYVFICSANDLIPALTYFYGNSPAGPWSYGGRIIDNSKNWNGGNNHGSIEQINGQWVVFYHRQTLSGFSRQAMAEPIQLRIEGDKVIIPPVEMTSQGIEPNGLDAFRRYNVNNLAYATNNARINGPQRNQDGLNLLIGIDTPGTKVGYKYFNFGESAVKDANQLKLKLNVQMLGQTSISVQVARPADVDDPKKHIALSTFDLGKYATADGKYHDITVALDSLRQNAALNAIGGLKGKLAFFLQFNGAPDNKAKGEYCRLKEVELAKGDTATPNPLREVRFKGDQNPHGVVVARPTMGRGGESIKLSVFLQAGYRLKSIVVRDEKGQQVPVEANGAAPYAPQSFNFSMPPRAINVEAEFARSQE